MDIDIDVKTEFDPCNILKCVRASMVQQEKLTKHPVGVYFQSMPIDEITRLAAIPYQPAEQLGYMKIDFLHLSVLDQITSKAELRELAFTEPDWSLLQREDVVTHLFQISNHFELVNLVQPKSVMELADCIALIRPGKRKLLGRYLNDRNGTRTVLYHKEHAADYRKSHAIAYAHNIIIQMNMYTRKQLIPNRVSKMDDFEL